MKAGTIALSGVLVAICGMLFTVLIVGGIWMSANNREIALRNAFNAQQKANESSFDKTWKIVSQQAGIADHERESFRKTYSEIMSASKGIAGNGQLASFFTQAKVDVSADLFKQLSASVEGQRESFNRDQQHLLKIKQEHDNVISQFPSSIFVGGRPRLEAKIVTSSKTEAVFESGHDNDVSLFSK